MCFHFSNQSRSVPDKLNIKLNTMHPGPRWVLAVEGSKEVREVSLGVL